MSAFIYTCVNVVSAIVEVGGGSASTTEFIILIFFFFL